MMVSYDLPLHVIISSTYPHTTPLTKCDFGVFHRVENSFLKFFLEELLGLHLVLDFYQNLYGHHTLHTCGLLHPV